MKDLLAALVNKLEFKMSKTVSSCTARVELAMQRFSNSGLLLRFTNVHQTISGSPLAPGERGKEKDPGNEDEVNEGL